MPWSNEDTGKLFTKLDHLIEILEPKAEVSSVIVPFHTSAFHKKRGRPKGSKNAKRTIKHKL